MLIGLLCLIKRRSKPWIFNLHDFDVCQYALDAV